MNCDSDAPDDVKYDDAVPSGPMNVVVPVLELLAAIWNFTLVLAGSDAFQDSVVQVGV